MQSALKALEAYAPDPATLAVALGRPGRPDHGRLYPRVVEKLRREPVEDFRIDFEDGFGMRPDPEEDRAALEAADEVLAGMVNATLPPFIGIRIKQLSPELRGGRSAPSISSSRGWRRVPEEGCRGGSM